ADTALAQARDLDDRSALAAAAAAVDALLAVRTKASNTAALHAAASLAMELGELLATRPEEKGRERGDARQAELIETWLAEHPQPAPLAKVARARAARYRQHELESEEMYGNGHTLRTQGDFAGARTRLEEVVARPEWKRTAARELAVRELDELTVAVSRQEALGLELDRAMDKGDIARCYALIRELGIKYPPLLVQSEPPGAEVWQDGRRIGIAPLKLPIPGGERAAASFELRRDGYLTRTISGSAAENGWRLVARLERSAVQRLELALTVTSRPTVLDGHVWVANRQQAVAVALGTAKPERVLFESAAASAGTLTQPLYTAPVLADDGVLFATRDGLALRVTGSGGTRSVERLPLGGRSDLPLVSYRSQNIVGRRFLVIAGQDGALHAVDEHHPELAWNGPAGAPFAAAPSLVAEHVLAVRQDGRLESVQADDGQSAPGANLDATVIAAWATPTGLSGFTTGRSWTWDGTSLSGADLPQPAVAGGAGMFITADNHAWIMGDDAQHPWRDLGRFEGRLSAEPLVWHGHAVLPLGHSLVVLGAKPFTVTAAVDILAPALLGEQLVVTTMDGVVSIYAP
ncbi:MAG: PQQ-binding-like beta-propeller repeat protein, partial [Planctomycetes bacterium]|nr:PQQ-binding-like beta-propeller repeat protein [Planctomycetota bacterium]